jgi:hypothetical protein
MTEKTVIGILINNSITDMEVTTTTTVLNVLRYIRSKYNLSRFESLELKYQGKTLEPNETVFTASFSKGKVVFECVRRKFFGFN